MVSKGFKVGLAGILAAAGITYKAADYHVKHDGPLEIVQKNDGSDASTGDSVLYFSAVWCAPCRYFLPDVKEVAGNGWRQKHGIRDLIGTEWFYIDIDKNSAFAERYGIEKVPTIVMLKDGSEAARIVGTVPKEELEKKIKEIL